MTEFNPATAEFLKQQQVKQRRQRIIASAVGVVLVAAIGFGGYRVVSANAAAAEAVRAQQLAASTADPLKLRETLGAAVERGEISRGEARRAGRDAIEKQFQARVDGYFDLPATQRQAYLDKQIDEWVQRRAEWEKNRPRNQPGWQPKPPTSRPADPAGDAERAARREERSRERTDTQSPLERERRGEFGAAIERRMKERGLEGGGFGGRGPGSFMGGPGSLGGGGPGGGRGR